MFARLWCESLMLSGHERSRRSYESNRTAILRACSEMFKRIKTESDVRGRLVDVSSCDRSSTLNGLYTSEKVCGMLEVKNYRHFHYMFPFIAAFIDRIRGERVSMTNVISMLCIEIFSWALERSSELL